MNYQLINAINSNDIEYFKKLKKNNISAKDIDMLLKNNFQNNSWKYFIMYLYYNDIKLLFKSIELGNLYAKYYLGIYYFGKKKYLLALNIFKELIKISYNNAYRDLLKTYVRMKKKYLSRFYLKKYFNNILNRYITDLIKKKYKYKTKYYLKYSYKHDKICHYNFLRFYKKCSYKLYYLLLFKYHQSQINIKKYIIFFILY